MSGDEVRDELVLCAFHLFGRLGDGAFELAMATGTGEVLDIGILACLLPILGIVVAGCVHGDGF